jgi:hypothetical protein
MLTGNEVTSISLGGLFFVTAVVVYYAKKGADKCCPFLLYPFKIGSICQIEPI